MNNRYKTNIKADANVMDKTRVSVKDSASRGFFGKRATALLEGQDPRSMDSLFVDLDTQNLDDVVEKCGFNFEAKLERIFGESEIPYKQRGVYNSHTRKPLGVVGESFVQVQPIEAVAAMHHAVKESGARYLAGGYVRGGSRIFLAAETSHSFLARPGDKVVRTIMLTTAFDGTGAFKIVEVPFRLTCKNQLRGIMMQKGVVSIVHSTNAQQNIKALVEGMGKLEVRFQEFQSHVKKLQQTKLDKDMVQSFLDSLLGELPNPEKLEWAALSAHTRQKTIRDEIEGLINGGRGNTGDTMWDAYNGLTEYVDYSRGKDDKRMESALFGSGARMASIGMEKALALV